jgi:hypothetical protein
MGEKCHWLCQLSFHKFLRVEFQGSRVTSDGGLVLVRDLDERLGLTGWIQKYLMDSCTGRNTQSPGRICPGSRSTAGCHAAQKGWNEPSQERLRALRRKAFAGMTRREARWCRLTRS